MRITGILLSGSFYIFGFAYLASPHLGWELSSASMAAAFGALPFAAKVTAKFALAWPFAFHFFNGLRYLTWDTARAMTNMQVKKTGWLAVGVATISALVLAVHV